MEEEHEMTSLRARRKKPSVGISCCFSGTSQHRRRASFDATSSNSSPIPHPSPRMSPSAWIKSKAHDFPEIKGKCRSFISRMARHRRHSSADFSYDPLSYALNFDEDAAPSSDEYQAMHFTARLPVSPPRRTTTQFDHHHHHHHLPRSRIPISPPGAYYTGSEREELATPEIAARSDELRRGFEALSMSMKRSHSVKKEPGEIKLAGERRNYNSSTRVSSTPRADEAEGATMTSPVGISSNRGILVELR